MPYSLAFKGLQVSKGVRKISKDVCYLNIDMLQKTAVPGKYFLTFKGEFIAAFEFIFLAILRQAEECLGAPNTKVGIW